MSLFLASVVLALSISALCSLLEATLLSFTPSQAVALSSRHPRAGAIWRSFKLNIEKPIAVILIVNTAAHTIGATLAGAQFEVAFGERWLIAFSLLFTYLMLQFTEILPKTLGVRYRGQLAPVIARPLQGLVTVLSPVLWFIHLINRPFERRSAPSDNTLEEITALAAAARLSQHIDAGQEQIIRAAARLEVMRIRQVMTPRQDVAFLLLGQPLEEILDILRDTPYTRLPLCDGDIDHIVGFIHLKDLLKHIDLVPGRFDVVPEGGEGGRVRAVPGTGVHLIGSGDLDLLRIRRDVTFLPEHVTVLDALRRFQASRQHLAVVVDEHGASLGIVTLEDIIEEVVGEIQDEFDPPAPELMRPEGDGYRVSGRMPLHELALRLPAADVEAQAEGVDTVAGYVAKVLGRMPQTGDTAAMGFYQAQVTAATRRRVDEVLLTPRDKPEDPPSQAGNP